MKINLKKEKNIEDRESQNQLSHMVCELRVRALEQCPLPCQCGNKHFTCFGGTCKLSILLLFFTVKPLWEGDHLLLKWHMTRRVMMLGIQQCAPHCSDP